MYVWHGCGAEILNVLMGSLSRKLGQSTLAVLLARHKD